MRRDYRVVGSEVVSELALVDTFTKLIFGEVEYSPRERMIIEAFREVDVNVLRDSYSDMGEYLRNLGVREMIHLVARLREHMLECAHSGTPGLADVLQDSCIKH